MLMDKKLHLGIIMDGNRRWAKLHNKPIFYAYDEGARIAKEIIQAAFKNNLVSHLTMWVLSEENRQKRSEQEINYIILSFHSMMLNEWDSFMSNNISFNVIGNKSCFNENIIKDIDLLTQNTKRNKYKLYFAFNYNGREEIIQGCYKYFNTSADTISLTRSGFHKFLYAPDMPDVDLVIRTGNRKSLSGFLLWHIDYAELMFLEKFWPDFNVKDLTESIEFFHSLPSRKFGE
jgi:undecaprenyl diphosphate synthase